MFLVIRLASGQRPVIHEAAGSSEHGELTLLVWGWLQPEFVCLAMVHWMRYDSLVMSKKQELKALFHCVFSLHVHLVLVTKYGRRCITAAMLNRLREIFRDLAIKWECELLDFNGEPDHVHLLLSLNPKAQPSKLVNNFKTVSSRLIRKEFKDELSKVYRQPVFWSRSYCILSCGGAPLSVTRQYIEQQSGTE